MTALPVVTPEDCWNRIGVHGDRSCPELARVVHCHNCGVFAGAGRRFLDAPSPDGYLEEWTRRLAAPIEAVSNDLEGVLIFRLAGEWLALPVCVLVEVTTPRPVRRVPHRGGILAESLNDLRDEPTGNWGGLGQVVHEIEELGRPGLGCVGDVTIAAEVERIVKETIDRFGRIDILVNNAGSQAGPDRVPVVDLDEAVFDRVLAVNAQGTFLCCRAVARHIRLPDADPSRGRDPRVRGPRSPRAAGP